MTAPRPARVAGLDLRVVLGTVLRGFAPWLVAVLLATAAGYPGVICVTPLAWLMALWVGLRCASRSTSPRGCRRLLEAALAGGLFGLLQGVLFLVIVPRLGEVTAAERASAILLSVGMVVVGVFAAAGLATLNALLLERRRA